MGWGQSGSGGREGGGTDRLVELFPDTDRLVVRACDDELAGVADGEGPYLAVVPLKLLDVLKLLCKHHRQHLAAMRPTMRTKRTLSPSQYFNMRSLPTVQK